MKKEKPNFINTRKLVTQCLHDELQERPFEAFTQLHNIAKEQTTNMLLSSVSDGQHINNVSLTGPIHYSHLSYMFKPGGPHVIY